MFLRGLGIPLVFVLWVAPLVLGVIALVDATRRPDHEWERSSQNKTLWIVLIAVGFVMCILGVAIDLIYLLTIRPQLERAGSGAGAGAGAGTGMPVFGRGPQPGWYPDPYGRHELRYFDGMTWSTNVADAGVPGVDVTT